MCNMPLPPPPPPPKNYPRERKEGGGEYTDKKENKIFLIYVLGNSEGSDAKSYMTNGLLIYDENMCAFPHILGSPSSYKTLHPISSEFPHI